jgi:uncharacterized protein YciI
MPYVIIWHQDEGMAEKRQQLRPVHLEHIIKSADRIIASGGIFGEDDKTFTGGLVILDTDLKDEAAAWIESDPFFINGIFTKYTLHRWTKAIFDHRRVSI